MEKLGHAEALLSRGMPMVFRICRESRLEAFLVYELRNFDTDAEFADLGLVGNGPIYWLPDKDIIYFGDKCCTSTMVYLFNPIISGVECQDIPNAAIINNDREDTSVCCNIDEEADLGIPDLQALHGIDRTKNPNVYSDAYQNGCPGLRNLYIVMNSQHWPVAPGDIVDHVGLRPATTCGLTKNERGHRFRTEDKMKCANKGRVLWLYDGNDWIGDRKPNFYFVSLAPHVYSDNCVYDGMGVDDYGIWVLGQDNWAMLKNLQDAYKCIIKISPISTKRYSDFQDQRELSFQEPKSAVEEIKGAIKQKLTEVGALWVKPNQDGSEYCDLGWDEDGYDHRDRRWSF
jgi:hypothetical protein